MTTIKRRLILFVGGMGLLLALSLSGLFLRDSLMHAVVIGSKNDTEGNILSEILAQYIEYHTDIQVKRNFFLEGTFICFNALLSNEIDLYVEYSGTAYAAIMKGEVRGRTSKQILEELRKTFQEDYNLVWLDPLGFQNAYVLFVHPEVAKKYQLETLSDLARAFEQGAPLKVAFDPEFNARDEVRLLEEGYELPLKGLQLLEHSLLYLTLSSRSVDVINGYSTDGMGVDYVILKDDKQALPLYEAIPLVREGTLKKFPELDLLLKKLSGKFSEREMCRMNYAVEKKGESIYDVVHTFLKDQSLIW